MIDLLSAPVDAVLAAGERMAGGDARKLVAPADLAAAEERVREEDRRRTLAGRLALRLLAGRRICERPAALTVDRSCDRCGAPHGRPRLAGLSASTSTSGDRVLVAVGPPDAELGVDVQVVPERLWDGFDEYALHPSERRAGLDAAERIRLWAEKEAVLKAAGHGLRAAPSRLRLGGGEPWRAVAETAIPGTAHLRCTVVERTASSWAVLASARELPLRRWSIDPGGEGLVAEPVGALA
ncbi:4'-phosphopantetheinyl transferase family protein [Arenivirga flava]|uniref:4'-phosphopantetheinyl transferase domain-containing protein n=1 Tax=Arenivirga flava TaxID=1930060 RepID=A0AA37UHR3_9MICO|nr:4'-phosphopantetheinyl transferase superfamily protein [Arenivirga flava]GMA27185.1 hypothetical protein GCM10025874_04380 [Arenivirga flava]